MSKFAWAGGTAGMALGGAVAGIVVLAGFYATRLLEHRPAAPAPTVAEIAPGAPAAPGGPFPGSGAVMETQDRANADTALGAADVQAATTATPLPSDAGAGEPGVETATVAAPRTGAGRPAEPIPEERPPGAEAEVSGRRTEEDKADSPGEGVEQDLDGQTAQAVSTEQSGAGVGDPPVAPDTGIASSVGSDVPGSEGARDTATGPASGISSDGPVVGGGTTNAAARAAHASGNGDVRKDPVAEDAAATSKPPSFDIVRVTPDGSALVAGRAEPGAQVSLQIDGVSAGTTDADATGSFVAFLSVPRGSGPRVLSMSSAIAGVSIAAESEVILAPSPRSGGAVVSLAPDTARVIRDGPAESDGGGADETPTPDLQKPDALTEAATAPAPAEGEAPPAPAGEDAHEAERVAVLLSGPDGVEVLQPAAPLTAPVPEAQDFVSIDTISYDATGQVALAGRSDTKSGPGAVRIYLDNRPLTSADISPTGRWRADLPEVAAGTYTLRVDRLNETGAVTARAESPFLRERPEALVAASPRSRDARVEAVTVQPGNTLWAIAREQYGEGILYVRVFEANEDQIRDPDLIYPGQIFSIPE
ncbi:LysM peptidoglycan-binding domain-containing protein [Roseivivax sediminis]|uniref:Nucleoid-associated protein YgaU, contains BON and LysM domains n=1 Tax=Roseivivax sediminis TaxID=936889 RepID=A0A1I2DJ28_9RHOB|nr:LysM peptidoglycan-binding domain-containing protein [Roseivivax sediminis]SFE80516.1 Nucleoid-associated protein YgaU, contains BON and LysM domains [Roseivivax sediminis]